MPRILVLGATGYLGNTVALTLIRSGLHTVYGLTRSASSGKALAKAEIIPVVCPDPANDPSPYVNAIKAKRIDVVIDCTAAYGDSVKFLRAVKEVAAERGRAWKAEGIEKGPKMGYVYLSGAWVHGNSPDPVSDVDPVGTQSAKTKALEIVSWRPDIEREVLGARDAMDVIVFRPGTLYGRASGLWSGLFAGIAQAAKAGQGEVQLPLPADARVPLVHIDDAADAIARGVAGFEALGGCYPVFDLVGSTERLGDVMDAFARVIAGEGSKVRVNLTAKTAGESGNPYMEGMGATVNLSSARAKQVLGWEAKRAGYVDGMEVYARAWESSQ